MSKMKKFRPAKAQMEMEPQVKAIKKEELNLFAKPLGQNSIKQSHELEYSPIAAISEHGNITFSIPKNERLFTDMSQFYIEIDVQVLKADGTIMVENDRVKIQPVNLLFHALFKRINLYLNSVKVGAETSFYPQIALINHLMSYDLNFLTDQLGPCVGFYKDFMYPGSSAPVRHQFIEKSKIFKMIGRLSTDFFTCNRLITPNVAIDITLDRTISDFCLIKPKTYTKTEKKMDSAGKEVTTRTEVEVTENYKLKIIDCKLLARRVELTDPAYNQLETRLAQGAIGNYDYVKSEARSFQIPVGQTTWRANNLFSGKLPTRVVFAVMEPESLGSGSIANNPMIFPASHYKLNYFQLYSNERAVLTRPYEPQFESRQYQRSFMALLKTARTLHSGNMIALNYSDYGQCYGLLCVDLCPDETNLSDSGTGALGLEIRFGTALPHALSGFLLGEFRSCVMVDGNANVTQSDY